uniref:Uncharacterized protein n=1 Tax=Glossina brevipalpis TaxID=37001 RepID=A0A1A9WQT2_9MUSC
MMLSQLFKLIVMLGLLFAVRVYPLNATFNGSPSSSAFSWNNYRLDADVDVTDDLSNKRMQIWYYPRPLYLRHDLTPSFSQQMQSNDGNTLPKNIDIDSDNDQPEVVNGNSNTNSNNNNNINIKFQRLPATTSQQDSKSALSTEQQQKLLRLYTKLHRDNEIKKKSEHLIHNKRVQHLQQPQALQAKRSLYDIKGNTLWASGDSDRDIANDYIVTVNGDRENRESKANNADTFFASYLKRVKPQEKQQQRMFSPAISGSVMTNLGKFFRDLSKNVHYSEQYHWGENEQKLLKGHGAIGSFQNHPPDALPDPSNGTADNTELIEAIRFYRPSQKIRSLVAMNPHGQWSHDSNFIDPNYIWVGLGK